MKKLLTLLTIVILGVSLQAKAAVSFEDAFKESTTKPMLVLVYAQWADDYATYLQTFKNVQNEFGDKFNYVELNIASEDTKFFNSRYHIYPNLPYVLMFRDGGKISRYVPNNCANKDACLIPKIKTFLN